MSGPLFCSRLSSVLVCVALLSGASLRNAAAQYAQTNLASDSPSSANFLDPFLSNPTGMSFAPTSPIWIANQGSNTADLHQGDGLQVPLSVQSPVLNVTGSPTGTVFNPNAAGSNAAFFLTDGTRAAPGIFLFATTSGQIQGWNPSLGGNQPLNPNPTETGFTSPTPGALYTGLAVGTTLNQANLPAPFLYTPDFHNGKIDVISGSFTSATLAGNFTDPNLPAGYAPFNIQTLAGKLFVSYAKQDTGGTSPVPGAGNGFIDVFNLDGTPGLANLNVRLISNGPLNEPWGMAIAPSTFGQFAGDLLVGNHGDGTIDAFDPITGLLLGMLRDAQGNPIVNPGLWALAFHPAASNLGFDPNELFFTSAPINPDFGTVDGLFGEISPSPASATPLPAALPLFATGLGALGFLGWRKKKKATAPAA
jgi:uncharacterized protein (TIGR03118 family)